jgi:predicted small secreted protein
MRYFIAILAVCSLTACATVDGARTDIGTGVEKIGSWIKPGEKQ